jgi:hypothetical protein
MQSVPITTDVVGLTPAQDDGVQHYVIKFVSVGGFLRVLRFPPIKLTATI